MDDREDVGAGRTAILIVEVVAAVILLAVVANNARGYPLGTAISRVVVLGIAYGVSYSIADVRVFATPSGLEVRNPVFVHYVAWSDITGFTVLQGLRAELKTRRLRLLISGATGALRTSRRGPGDTQAEIERYMATKTLLPSKTHRRLKWTWVINVGVSSGVAIGFAVLCKQL